MKKISKIIAVLAVLVAGSMIATAALVPYLSNTVTTTVTVSSPMEVGISLGRPSWATAQCYRPATNVPEGYTPPGPEVLDWGYCSCDTGRAGFKDLITGENPLWGTPPTYTTKQKDECIAASGIEWYETGGRDANAPYTGGYVLSFPEGVDRYGDPIHDWHENNWAESTITLPDGYGGETITIYTMSKNLANAEIKGIKELIVSNPDGVTCNDFESVKVRVDSIYGELGYGKQHPRPHDVAGEPVTDLLELCNYIDDYHVEFLSPCGTDTWGVGETDVSQWTITFMPNAVGTYTFTYRVIPETT